MLRIESVLQKIKVARNSNNLHTRPQWVAVSTLVILFVWFYFRFVHQMYFVMDDYIEIQAYLARPLSQIIISCFGGELAWSGYRPLACTARAVLATLFGIDHVVGYHVFGLLLHLINTLLVYRFAHKIFGSIRWGFIVSAIFLLLPSHNEALMFMDVNANLIALFFGLIAINAGLSIDASINRGRQVLSWLAYGLSVLAYEITIPLPFFLFLADWRFQKRWPWRKRIGFYSGFAIILVALLFLRYFAMSGSLTPQRSDYQISLNLPHLLQGYKMFLGQMVLLQTSATSDVPLFSNIRLWMSVADPIALLSMALMAILAIGVYLVTELDGDERSKSDTQSGQVIDRGWHTLFWMAWSGGWIFLLSLPFAALTGRNPENRYVYIPSLGYALLLTISFYLLWHLFSQRRVRHVIFVIPIALLVFYAYVDTSDLAEWTRAQSHVRAFMEQAPTVLPQVRPGAAVFQVGVPGRLGAAYLFTTQQSFRSAIQLLYDDPTLTVYFGDDQIKRHLAEHLNANTDTYLFVYDPINKKTQLADWIALCGDSGACRNIPLATGVDQIRVLNESQPQNLVTFEQDLHYLGYDIDQIYLTNEWSLAPLLVTHWQANRTPSVDWTSFVYLTNAEGEIVAQADHELTQAWPPPAPEQNGLFLTTSQWKPEQLVSDAVVLPHDTSITDVYSLSIRGGLWLPSSGDRATMIVSEESQIDQYGRLVISTAK